MNRHCVVAATFFGIAACATQAPEPSVSDRERETAVESSEPGSPEAGIEDAQAPDVPKVAQIQSQTSISDPDALVCRRITRTGSHLQKVVCQTRSSIDQRRTADQKELERINEQSGILVHPHDDQ